jgi:hypothetical protein
MSKTSDRAWAKGELYHSICLAWIGVCVWLIGVQLNLFATLHVAALSYGLADLVMLGCIMSLVLAIAAAARSWELRKVIAAREDGAGAGTDLGPPRPAYRLGKQARSQRSNCGCGGGASRSSPGGPRPVQASQ